MTAAREPVPSVDDEPEAELIDFDGDPDWTTTYVIAELTKPRKDILDPAARSDIDHAIIDTVRVEQPICWDRLCQRVRAAFGQGRLGSKIRAQIETRIEQLVQRNELAVFESGFLVLPGHDSIEVRVPDPDDHRTRRSTSEISWAELGETLAQLVASARSITPEDLTTATLRTHRWNRNAQNTAAVETALEAMLDEERFVRDDRFLRARN